MPKTTQLNAKLSIVLADTYALYLKTQNYHWHIRGENFISLHQLLEAQYGILADFVDVLAERIVTLKGKAPATFAEFEKLSCLKPGSSSKKSQAMIKELESDHRRVAEKINSAIETAKKNDDEASIEMLSGQLGEHEKMAWMLNASQLSS